MLTERINSPTPLRSQPIISAIGSTICTAGFPSAAIASNCFTARCASIWYGFFIATLLFLGKRKLLLAYQGFERGVASFYDLPGIPSARPGQVHSAAQAGYNSLPCRCGKTHDAKRIRSDD